MRRTKELIKTINETVTESEMDTSKISGVKWVSTQIQYGKECLHRYLYWFQQEILCILIFHFHLEI
jgi:hypothetical protein